MSRSNYKRLGDYIREVNVRNRDLAVEKLMGININKYFMPSVANVIGTDMSNYKIVAQNQFACNLMHVGRDEKIPMAMLCEEERIIVSPAYFVFEVIDRDELLPEYLMMWFSRSEFDRNAWFYTDADVRGGMNKGDLFDMTLPIPSIEIQREIVTEYAALSRRIALTESLCDKLEQTAAALYRKMFVDDIDPQNLPHGWRMGTIGEISTIKGGKRLPKGEELCNIANKHPYIRVADMDTRRHITLTNNFLYVKDSVQHKIEQYIVDKYDVILSIVGTIGNVNIVDETLSKANLTENCVKFINLNTISHNYLYSFLTSAIGRKAIEESIVGGVQSKLPIYNIQRIPIVIPPSKLLMECDSINTDLCNYILNKTNEYAKLQELRNILLSKLATN